jgi:phasin family protein
MTAATAVLAAKSVHEVMDVQIGFAQQRYDDFLAKGTKISELSIKTANEARALLRKRFEDNFARFVQTPSV